MQLSSAAEREAILDDILNHANAAIGRYRIYGASPSVERGDPCTIYEAACPWSIDYLSPGCETIYGYTPNELMADPALWISRVHPEDWQSVILSNLEKVCLVSGNMPQTITAEYRVSHREGGLRWISEHLTVRHHAEENCWMVTGIAVDITHRKQVEAALQQSETTQRAILQAMPDLLMVMRKDGSYLNRLNEGTFKTIPTPQIDDRPTVYDVLPHEVAELRLQSLQRAIATQELQIYQQQLEIEGEWRHQEVRTIGLNPDEALVIVRDITEQKQLEQALQVSDRTLRQLTEAVPGIVYQYRRSAQGEESLPYISARVFDLLHLTPEQLQKEAQKIWERVLPEDLELLLASVQRSAVSLEPWHHVYRVRDQHGQIRWLSGQALADRESDGSILWNGVIIDISDRKRSESLLEIQNQILAKIISGAALTEVLTTLILAVESQIDDAIGSILLLDSQGCFQSGVAPHLPEAYNQSLNGLMPGEGVGSCGTAIARQQMVIVSDIASDPLWKDCKELALPYGLRACWSVPVITEDGEALGTFGLYHRQPQSPQPADLEVVALAANLARLAIERHQTINQLEQLNNELEAKVIERTSALQASEERLRLVVQNMPIMLDAYDENGRLIVWNAECERVTGFTAWEVTHHPDSMTLLYPDENYRAEIVSVWAERGNNLRDWEAVITCKDGSQKTILWSNVSHSFPIPGWAGWAVGLDISDRKRAEMQLRQANETLAVANAELARANRLKDEFLANMSHELRTPLSSILGLSELLHQQAFGPLNEKQKQFMGTILQSGRHLLNLINDILDLAKIESGKLELSLAPTSIRNLCETSMAFVRQQAQQKAIALEMQLPCDFDLIVVDERRICQALINLLNNGVKFTPTGGSVALHVEANLQAGAICFSVIDTGIGIATQHIAHLFEPFVQIDSSLSRHYEGTGLGLALVKQIVELHSGSVSVESELGRGSRFMIALPYKSFLLSPESRISKTCEGFVASSGVGEAVPLPSLANAAPLVLLADDNPDTQLLLQDYLQFSGFRVVVARNGEEALRTAAVHLPDVILMDIQMPGVDGLEAIQRLKESTKMAKIPIIAVTALAMQGDSDRCLAAGANDYLSKPIQLNQLLNKLNHWSRGK